MRWLLWEDKRPALGFPEKEWFSLIDSALKMDELITRHSTIMDKYDPDKRVGLIVDEWGSWLAVEPGTNPGFLYLSTEHDQGWDDRKSDSEHFP